jgi:hypothetical protein
MRIPNWEIFQIPFPKKDEQVNTMLAEIQFRPLRLVASPKSFS